MIVILPILGITILACFCPFILLIIEVFSLIKKLKEKKNDHDNSKEDIK